ncbi:type VI secretion system baseplate subunit TssE [Rhizobium ruizarguesonis]|uniref:Type VI secretion system baseplate subunit TssE n=1 Tax=Rhizobium ruizarguesonis TaxID=2081791 RepID=A0ABY1WWT8_9HYPH|nr:type VI secretion system baseplate subunit TssE [Rhizobium ruizarguesonis]NKQ86449.1 type VI secretion system baseplate subunit TssE [Rhizobium ruizarguesonis]TAU28355.1 type VI secretion system baseplate subunit TssE [Rhizobium ruizarguesonis]TAU44659.1 type VI secretion system baseplate subunit TssE [Rhizobium ruizarguesonis]TAU57924.1 type VI secretion system baseplate subunit TssE [Rhizobium ruizarguesonis]TAU60731.1 type VI secretion system baseplate subunit TssE [Rhizobium ruizargueso
MVDPLERYRLRDRVLARSILDRLIDEAPDRTVDPPMSFVDQVRDVREAIRRDLEALLNTRRCPTTPPAALSELRDALVSYGVDGIVSANLMTDQAKLKLAQAIERRIALFETRLSDVRVTILKSRTMTERALRMRIQATFRLHEGMPPISFESTIDPSTQRFLVEAAHG